MSWFLREGTYLYDKHTATFSFSAPRSVTSFVRQFESVLHCLGTSVQYHLENYWIWLPYFHTKSINCAFYWKAKWLYFVVRINMPCIIWTWIIIFYCNIAFQYLQDPVLSVVQLQCFLVLAIPQVAMCATLFDNHLKVLDN